MKSYLYFLSFLLTMSSCSSFSVKKETVSPKVVLIGIDGLNVRSIQRVKTPTLDRLMAEGSYSLNARSVSPSSSGANWSTILSGASPQQTGVFKNSWKTDNYSLPAFKTDPQGYFPTIFKALKNKNPQLKSAVVHEWKNIAYYINPNTVESITNTKNTDETIATVTKLFDNENYDFTFIHFDEMDHVGHGEGHDSEAYNKALAHMDTKLGELLAFFDSKFKGNYYVFIVADHGGLQKIHGGTSPEEMTIPWVAKGPTIRKGPVKTFINTQDTPATVAYIFNTKLDEIAIGMPILEIFK